MESLECAERLLKELVRVKEDFTLSGQEKERAVKEKFDEVVRMVQGSAFVASVFFFFAQSNSVLIVGIRERLGKPSTLELAKMLFVEGKAKDLAVEEHSHEAEALLSKATKLDPQNVDCWNALGECLWKKKDAAAAIDCFVGKRFETGIASNSSL